MNVHVHIECTIHLIWTHFTNIPNTPSCKQGYCSILHPASKCMVKNHLPNDHCFIYSKIFHCLCFKKKPIKSSSEVAILNIITSSSSDLWSTFALACLNITVVVICTTYINLGTFKNMHILVCIP